MVSQPAPSGWQLTVGIVTDDEESRVAPAGRVTARGGLALAVSERSVAAALGLDVAAGVGYGPESRSQPLEQPVAADPLKVGEYLPKLDEVTEPVLVDVGAPDGAPSRPSRCA